MQEGSKYRLRKILIIQYIIFLGIYCAGDILLGLCGLEYRTWVEVIALMYLWLFPAIGISYLLFAWRERKKEQRMAARIENGKTADRGFQWCTGALLSVYGIGMILLSMFLFIFMIFTVDSEEKLDNGLLRVEKAETMMGGPVSYYEPAALLFRKETDWQEDLPAQSDPMPQDIEEYRDRKTEEADTSQKEYTENQQAFMEEYREKKENTRYAGVYEEDYELADAVWLIYEKHYIRDPDSEREAPIFYYNAKGNFYAKVTGRDNADVLLVYNGVSENGKCQLFVAEEEHYDTDGNQLDNTSLLEFYAVNVEEGQVYEAHKTSWGGAESEEYRNATRE